MGGIPSISALGDTVVLIVMADPKPLHNIAFVEAEGTIFERDAHGSQLANLLEMQ